MRTFVILLTGVAFFLLESCTSDLTMNNIEEKVDLRMAIGKATGEVQIAWSGGGHENNGTSGMTRVAFVELAAFAPDESRDKPAKGFFDLQIYESGELAREIYASVIATRIDAQDSRAWILAEVTDDSKSCTGHDPGHDDHNEEDHDTEGHDQGCSGEDHDTDGHVGGNRCRIGQILAIRLNDTGTPGSDGDMMMWRWFNAADPGLPDIGQTGQWPHLCGKTVIGGNLMVH